VKIMNETYYYLFYGGSAAGLVLTFLIYLFVLVPPRALKRRQNTWEPPRIGGLPLGLPLEPLTRHAFGIGCFA
jgi:hypothetical protein